MSLAIRRAGRYAAVLTALTLSLPTARAAAQEAAPESAIEVSEAVVATGVQDRAPVGAADSFRTGVERLYYYTIFEGDFPATTLEHVWLHEGEEVGRVSLRAEGPRWRTWSSKAIAPEWTGSWEARVVDSDGTVLASTSFNIGG